MVNPIDNEDHGNGVGEAPRMFLGQDVLQNAVLAKWVQALNTLSSNPYTIADSPRDLYGDQFTDEDMQDYTEPQQSTDSSEKDVLRSLVGNSAKEAGKAGNDLIRDMTDSVADGIKGLGEDKKEDISFDDVKDAVATGFDWTIDKVLDINDWAAEKQGEAANNLRDETEDTVTDFLDDTVSAFGWLKDKFTGEDHTEEREKNREAKKQENDKRQEERRQEMKKTMEERGQKRDKEREDKKQERDKKREEKKQAKQEENENSFGKKLSDAVGNVVQGLGHAAGDAVESLGNAAGNMIEGQNNDKRKDVLLTNDLPDDSRDLPYDAYTPDNYLSAGFESRPDLLLPTMKMMQEHMNQQLGGVASLAQGLYDAGASKFADMVTGGMPELEQQYPELFTTEDYGLDQGSVQVAETEQGASDSYNLADGLIEGGSWKGQGLSAAAAQSPRFDGPPLDPYSNKSNESRGLQA